MACALSIDASERVEDGPNSLNVLVEFSEPIPSITRASLVAKLEDVTEEDARQKPVIAEASKANVVLADTRRKKVKLKFKNIKFDADVVYNVRLVIDVDNNGKVSKGDYITQERFMFDGSAIPRNTDGVPEITLTIKADMLRKEER
jgi:hypothetical protein